MPVRYGVSTSASAESFYIWRANVFAIIEKGNIIRATNLVNFEQRDHNPDGRWHNPLTDQLHLQVRGRPGSQWVVPQDNKNRPRPPLLSFVSRILMVSSRLLTPTLSDRGMIVPDPVSRSKNDTFVLQGPSPNSITGDADYMEVVRSGEFRLGSLSFGDAGRDLLAWSQK